MTELHIFLYGKPRIELQGVEIRGLRKAAIAVLARLLISDHAVTRSQLVDFVAATDNTVEKNLADLRRAINSIKSQVLWPEWARELLEVDRAQVRLNKTDVITTDVWRFNRIMQHCQYVTFEDLHSYIHELTEAVNIHQNGFLAEFEWVNHPKFSEWQNEQKLRGVNSLKNALEQLIIYYYNNNQFDRSIEYAQHWLKADDGDFRAHLWLIESLTRNGELNEALRKCQEYRDLFGLDEAFDDFTDEVISACNQIRSRHFLHEGLLVVSPPPIFIGRMKDLDELKSRLGVVASSDPKQLTIIYGWPGVGKTTLVNRLTNLFEVRQAFKNKVLTIRFDDNEELLSKFESIAIRLLIPEIGNTIDSAVNTIRSVIDERGTKVLLVLDDVYDREKVIPFKQLLLSPTCFIIVTTRFRQIAADLATIQKRDEYKLDVLESDEALDLLKELANEVVSEYPNESKRLVEDLELLPLSIHVAGRLLHTEMGAGANILTIFDVLRQSHIPLDSLAPDNRFDKDTGTTPTISLLLRKTTDRLDSQTLKRFIRLGSFTAKPARFDIDAVKYIWKVDEDEARKTIHKLTNYSLIEFDRTQQNMYIHALLVAHAKSLEKEENF